MGYRSVRFNFTPGENERIETVIQLPEEHRSIIHGVVIDPHENAVKNAVVKLYEDLPSKGLKPLTHTFTDENGHFVFGPLNACRKYVIKVWANDIKISELAVRPDHGCVHGAECRRKIVKRLVSPQNYMNEEIEREPNAECCFGECHCQEEEEPEDGGE